MSKENGWTAKGNESDLASMYAALLSSADAASARRGSSNGFYLSLHTVIVSATSYSFFELGIRPGVIVLSGIGLGLALHWRLSLTNYRLLNRAKFEILHRIERKLPFRALHEEWKILTTKTHGYKRLTQVESMIPILFAIAYGAILLLALCT